jgi:hypothetical protein
MIARFETASQNEQASVAEAHGETRGIFRREAALTRRQSGSGDEIAASDAQSLVERISATSKNEIDKLIAQLQTLREFFQEEGQRIQREIAEYAHLGDAMLKSTKTMAESMVQLKNSGEIIADKSE